MVMKVKALVLAWWWGWQSWWWWGWWVVYDSSNTVIAQAYSIVVWTWGAGWKYDDQANSAAAAWLDSSFNSLVAKWWWAWVNADRSSPLSLNNWGNGWGSRNSSTTANQAVGTVTSTPWTVGTVTTYGNIWWSNSTYIGSWYPAGWWWGAWAVWWNATSNSQAGAWWDGIANSITWTSVKYWPWWWWGMAISGTWWAGWADWGGSWWNNYAQWTAPTANSWGWGWGWGWTYYGRAGAAGKVIVSYKTDGSDWIDAASTTGWTLTQAWWYDIRTFTTDWTLTIVEYVWVTATAWFLYLMI